MRRFTAVAAGLILTSATLGYAQGPDAPQDRVLPQFKIQIWGDTFVDFTSRVSAYDQLRHELEKGLPQLRTTSDVAEIRKAVRSRAKKIRHARADAREGDIFTPAISDSFKRALGEELSAATCEAIEDDNPGAFKHRINGSYPERVPVSTVPPNVLAVLPQLPDDLQYRFVGPHLVLVDGRSRVIVDRIAFVIPCAQRAR